MSVSAYIDARRREVDEALSHLLPAPPDCPQVLYDAMTYSLRAGGKRLRPVLCLASAEAVGGDRALAMPAACAIEMIHTYSLIHDDLPAMDNDTMRRGQPTLHVVAGDGMAILAGDGLLTQAFHLLSTEPRTSDPAVMARKLRVLMAVSAAAGPIGMVGGQAMDLACVTPDPRGHLAPALDEHGVRIMHGKKTGAMIRASAAAGAIIGGGTIEQVAAIDGASAELGLAFQIVDDVLDVEGASEHLGKTVGKDAAAGKPTYPSLYGVARSKQMAADCLARAEYTLRECGMGETHLLDIGRWVVNRTN